MIALSIILFAAAALGLLLVTAQALAFARHFRRTFSGTVAGPSVSVLKPLCGIDDDLAANLETFAKLDYRDYEVLLGVESLNDPALPLAHAACAKWPDRFRIMLRRGEPGLNPKVNQLMTLAPTARGEILVISDSNVRVHRQYLSEIAGLLQDPDVGLVTHLVAGVGEQQLGSLMDSLHLAGAIAPGVVAAKLVAGQDIVVGKSMALRREDLERLGGLAAVKDVLAEDYVLGRLVSKRLGKRVVLASTPVENVTQRRSVLEFALRYQRWHVMQRRAAGLLTYSLEVLLNPVFLAAIGAAARPCLGSAAAFLAVCGMKVALDGASARQLRPGGFRLDQLALIPVKDLVIALAWAQGLMSDRVAWRGRRLRVLPETRLEPVRASAPRPGAPVPAKAA
jgi:ceramide glucosyltransferase